MTVHEPRGADDQLDVHVARATRRQHAETILRAAITAADPRPLVRHALETAPELQGDEPVRLVALGKAAPPMAEPAFELLGDRIIQHVIIAPAGTPTERPILFGAHPLPDESSVAAGRVVHDILHTAGPDEVVLVLLSGGGSAIAVQPLEPIAVDEYADCVARLMHAGADIGDLNLLRRHIDGLKGGRMAALAARASVLGLVLSDVVGDPLDTIASGPLSPDSSSAADALRLLRRYSLIEECAESIHHVLTTCVRTGDGETPGPGSAVFERVRVRVVGGNDVAINGAADAARRIGYDVRRATHPVVGPAREAGVGLAREALLLQRDAAQPVCIVAGGETTVLVHGAGQGGRNQEIVLAACIELAGTPGITVGSVGTDGVDGPTDAAGAIADETTLSEAASLGLAAGDALARNDSHTFFRQAGGLVTTGPTGTNVNDVQIALITPPSAGDAD